MRQERISVLPPERIRANAAWLGGSFFIWAKAGTWSFWRYGKGVLLTRDQYGITL